MTTTTLEKPAAAPADPIAAVIADIDGLPEPVGARDRATGHGPRARHRQLVG